MPDMSQPLTQANLDQINTQLEGIRSAMELVRKAKTAGIDVSTQEQQLMQGQEKLLRVKQAFFPGQA